MVVLSFKIDNTSNVVIDSNDVILVNLSQNIDVKCGTKKESSKSLWELVLERPKVPYT